MPSIAIKVLRCCHADLFKIAQPEKREDADTIGRWWSSLTDAMGRTGTRFADLRYLMTDAPPPDPPPDPPHAPQVSVEATLPDTEEAKHLYLAAEAIRQRAKELSEEVTLTLQRLDVPLKK